MTNGSTPEWILEQHLHLLQVRFFTKSLLLVRGGGGGVHLDKQYFWFRSVLLQSQKYLGPESEAAPHHHTTTTTFDCLWDFITIVFLSRGIWRSEKKTTNASAATAVKQNYWMCLKNQFNEKFEVWLLHEISYYELIYWIQRNVNVWGQ